MYSDVVATTTSVSKTFAAGDWYIKVVWATSDLDQFNPKSAPLLARQTGSSSNPAHTTSSGHATTSGPVIQPSQSLQLPGSATGTQPPSSTTKAAGGLSTGAEAGIGVGAAIAVIAIFLLAVLVFKWRRLKGAASTPTENMAQDPRRPQRPVQLDSHQIYETDASQRPLEMDSWKQRPELDSGWRRYEMQSPSTPR